MENKQPPSKESSRKQFYFLTLTHTVLDSYATLLSHLQPLLLTKLATAATRNSLAGRFISIYSIFSSFGQILFGWLSDRVRTVHFVTFGVGLTAVGLSLLWVAPSTKIVYVLLAIGGIGIAAFHPQATTYAGALASSGRGMGTSIFLTGGNIGRALGPLVLMFIPYRFGLDYLVWEMIPGVIMALFVPKVLKFDEELDVRASTRGTPMDEPRTQESFWTVARPRLLPLVVLFTIAAFRTVTAVGLENFLSVHLDNLNYTNQVRSLVIALFIFAGSMGIMSSGWLITRVNTYVLLLVSLLGAPPLLYASLHTSGFSSLVLLFLGNVALSSSITVNIILAQMMLRGHENIASSFMMGAAWGVGGVLNQIVGIFGDRFGLPIVLDGLVMIPLLMAPLLILLRDQPDLSKPSL
jgi:FSR family fosmidomycin resistance protein-like MFS transporter